MRSICGCDRHGATLGRRGLLATAAGLACLGASIPTPPARAAGAPRTSLTPDEALERLMEGNARFRAGHTPPDAANPARRASLATGQAPFAAILGCADSRTPPELLFHAGLGELFVVRNAGQVADTAAIGSLEYAVAELGVPLVMVLGHESCGAAAAAVTVARSDPHLPGRIKEMVLPILPAAVSALRAGGDAVDGTVTIHVSRMVEHLYRSSPVIAGAMEAGRLKLAGARYDLDEGRVSPIS